MTVYLIYLFIITVQWGIIGGFRRNSVIKAKKNFLIIACVELIVLVGVRGYGVGADTGTYLSALDYYSSLPKSEIFFAKLVYPYDFEIGFFLLIKLCAWLGINKTIFLFCVAIIIYIPVFFAIYKYSPKPYISVLTYFAFGLFAYSLGIFRQMIAVSIVLCGIKYIINRRFLQYFLIVLLAMTFHKTAVIALILYFTYPIKWEINAMIGLVGCVIALVLGRNIIVMVCRFFPSYSHYIGSIYDATDNSYTMICVLLILWLFSYLRNKKRRVTQGNKIAFDALSVSLIVQNLGYHMGIFGRVIGYFSIFYIYLTPNIVSIFAKKQKLVANIVLIVFLFIMTIVQMSDWRVQYVTIWS